MANYSVKLHPNLVDLGTEGSLDTSVLNGKSIQRTVSGITIINLGERKTLGRLKDGEQFSDVVETLCDYLNISSDDCNPEEELYVEITASGILIFGESAIYELISDENNSYNYSASGLFALGQSADYNNNTGWGALFGIDTVNSDLYYPQSADMDADGNVYYASVNTSGNPVSSILRKMDSNGNILWEKPDYGIDETHTPVKVKVSINGGIYVIYQQRMIRRIDSNGVELWKFNQNLEYYSVFSFDGFVEDSNGNIFVVGSASGLLLCKFNSSGTLIKETQLNVGGNINIVGDIVIDNSGNLIVPFSIYLNDGGLSTVLIKITNDLLSYTWYTTLSQDYGYIYDASVTAFGKDNSDNFYVLTYGSNTVTKINGSGTIIWAKDITASEVPALNGMAVDNDGNCYVVCGDSDGGTFIRVLKVDTNGNIIWSYRITFTSGMEFINQGGYYYTTNSAVQIKNGYMILLTIVQIQASPFIIEEFVMKLPLEKITGTFGDFVFSDDILNVSMTDLSPVDNSSNVSISFVESSIVSPGSGQLFEEPEFSQTLTLVPIVTGE